VTISYAGGSTYQQTTNGNGVAQFTNQPIGIGASIVATTTDGSGRTATLNSSGFVAGNNSVTVTLPAIKTGSITGTVTGASNAPLAGVDVVVLNASTTVVASALTGAGGTYNITGLAAGTYSMTFSLASYVTGSIGGVVVNPGAATTESISLVTVSSTQAAVMVAVTDAGSPAVGATVSIAYSNGTSSSTLTTNSAGQVTFTGQPAGVVGTVTAIAGDGTGRSISSTPAAFPAQTTTSVNLALPPVSNATISGTITDSNLGSAITGVTVTVTDSHGNVVGTATSSSSGYSVGGLGLQTYTVTFTDNGYLTYVGQTAGNTILNVRLAPLNATVNVQVNDTFGNPISAATITITYVGYNLVATGTTNSSGFVSIGSQPSTLSAVVSVLTTDGRTASHSQTFNFGNNRVSLTVTSDFGAVSGVVVDSSTSSLLAGATVAVVDYNNNPVATTTTDSTGAYVVENLIPGTYTFTFTDNAYQTLTLTVPATAGVTTTENASLTPSPGSIKGSVTGSVSQSPVPGAQIALQGPVALSATSDSNGNFNVANAPPGSYTGTLTSGIFTQPISATVVSNQVTTLNLILDTSGIAGKVTDQNGNPLSGAQVVLTGAGFTSFTVVSDQFGNYNANRESNTGSMTITATYTFPGYGTWTGTEQLSVASSPPVQVIPPIVVTVPATLNTVVTLNGNPLSGAQVTLDYQTGTTSGPITTVNGSATFNSITLGDPATVYVLYVDGTGTVYAGSAANQSFVPGTNTVTLALAPAGSGQSGRANIQVTDQNGNALAGASVSIVYSGGATSATMTTDSNGNVLFTSQQSGVAATINVSYTDSLGNVWTSSQSIPSGLLNGNNYYAVTVTT
jgi:large repetitive protein